MNLDVQEFGTVSYEQARHLQRQAQPPTVLVGEFLPVFTRGPRAPGGYLGPLPAPVIDVLRGGDVTYHAPGQLALLPVLEASNADELTAKVERAVIAALSDEGVNAGTAERCPGVWVEERKIASLGFVIRDGLLVEGGVAVNVNLDLEPFRLIRPCGLDVQMTSIAEETGEHDHPDFKGRLLDRLAETFGFDGMVWS